MTHPRATAWCAGRVVADSVDDRDAWLEARTRYITASDVAKALSIPWTSGRNGTPGAERYASLIASKRGQTEPRAQTEQMWWGSELEPHIIERLGRAPGPTNGWDVRPCGLLIEDAECRALAATPDFWAHDGERAMVGDLKISAFAWRPTKLKPSREQYIPLDYQWQIQAQIACTGATHGVLVQYVGNYLANVEVFERNSEMIQRARLGAEMAKMEIGE